MTSLCKMVHVQHALIFVHDPTVVERPQIWEPELFWSTSGCVAVSCMPDSEGPTRISGGSRVEVGSEGILLVDVLLPTPSREVIVETVYDEVMKLPVSSEKTRLRVWTDGLADTAFVAIALD